MVKEKLFSTLPHEHNPPQTSTSPVIIRSNIHMDQEQTVGQCVCVCVSPVNKVLFLSPMLLLVFFSLLRLSDRTFWNPLEHSELVMAFIPQSPSHTCAPMHTHLTLPACQPDASSPGLGITGEVEGKEQRRKGKGRDTQEPAHNTEKDSNFFFESGETAQVTQVRHGQFACGSSKAEKLR